MIPRVNAEVAKFMHASDVKALPAKSGLDPATNTPAEFATLVRADLEK